MFSECVGLGVVGVFVGDGDVRVHGFGGFDRDRGASGSGRRRRSCARRISGCCGARSRRSGGTEVKNLGDGLMVMYSSPSRALAGAVGMQQAIDHHNRSAEQPLGVRIGVSTGEAVEEDGDYFGDPVVVAARLCAAAEGGQILAADLVRLMVGRHATQTFVELGALELKGLPEPVDAVEVLWEPATVGGFGAVAGPIGGGRRPTRCSGSSAAVWSSTRCTRRASSRIRRSGARWCSWRVRRGWARPRSSPRSRARRTARVRSCSRSRRRGPRDCVSAVDRGRVEPRARR